MKQTVTDAATRAALAYLSERNPLHISQTEYFARLVEFAGTHGDNALQALAGFHAWITLKEKARPGIQHLVMVTTFAHDLGDIAYNKRPRSADFQIYWPPFGNN